MKKRIKPGPGQESVWDYPRPPLLERSSKHIKVYWQEQLIASSNMTYRILETSHPPVYYIPPADVAQPFLQAADKLQTFCEWKGSASYWNIIDEKGQVASKAAAWNYAHPRARYTAIKDYLAFYPSRVTACFVDDEQVNAQAGDFYGGWITSDIVGPFKGEAGTWGW